MKDNRKLKLFIILVFIVSFLFAGICYLIWPGQTRLVGMPYMFMPMICAMIIQKLVYKESLRLNISFKFNRWFLVAWLTPLFLGFGAIGIALLMPDISYSTEMEGMMGLFSQTMPPEAVEQMKEQLSTLPLNPVILTAISGLIAGLTINGFFGFGEEYGWRGFMLGQLRKMSYAKASLLIGTVWGFWHAPLVLQGHNYPEHPVIGVFMMVVWCILLTFLFNYVTIKSRSVIATSIMHGSLNGTAGVGMMLLSGGNDLTIGVTGLAGFIALAIVIAGFYFYDTKISKEKIMYGKIGDYIKL